MAEVYGHFLNDRILIWIACRHRGHWHPEYRLHSLWISCLVIMPAGLGLFGCALRYHLHYMVLAVGSFFVTTSAIAAVPVPLNYLVESFAGKPREVGTSANVYRLLLAFVVPFILDPWERRVGVNWVFGMAAFFTLLGLLMIGMLVWKGAVLRRYSIGTYSEVEEQARLTKEVPQHS